MSEYAIAPSALNLANFTHKECSDLSPRQWLASQNPQGMIIAAHLPYDVCDGSEIWLSRKDWDTQQRGLVVFVAIPQGGKKGDSNPLLIVASLALAAFAPWAAGAILGSTSGLAFSALSAGIGIIGQSLISKAFGPSPAPSNAALPAASPTYSNQIRGNQARLNEAIPVQYGELVFPPEFIQQPYVYFSNDKEYLCCLYCLGQGAFEITKAGFGAGIELPVTELYHTHIQSAHAASRGMPENGYHPSSSLGGKLFWMGSSRHHISIIPPVSYVAKDINNFDLDNTEWSRWFKPVPRFATADRIVLNFVIPGLYYAEDNGSLSARTITFEVQAQQINDEDVEFGPIENLPNFTITAGSVNTLKRSHTAYISSGRWCVRVRRLEAVSTDQRLNNKSIIHSIVAHNSAAKLPENCTYLAIKVRATGQLSGSMNNQFYVSAKRRLARLDSEQIIDVSTDNATYKLPQVAIADMLRSHYGLNAGGRIDSDAHLKYLPALNDFLSMGSANTYPASSDFNFRFDSPTPLMDAIAMASKPALATPYLMGGSLYFAVPKSGDLLAQQVIEGVESYSESISMPRSLQATAIEVEYWSDRYNRLDTVLCRLSEDLPTQTDKVNLYGITSADDAYTQGMKQLISAKVQTQEISYETDISGRIPLPMDRVELGFIDEFEAQTGYIIEVEQTAQHIRLQLSDDPLIDYSAEVAGRILVRTSSGQSMQFKLRDEPNGICEVLIRLSEPYAHLLLHTATDTLGISNNPMQYAIALGDNDDDLSQYSGMGTLCRVLSVSPGNEGKVSVTAIKDTPLLYQEIGYAPEPTRQARIDMFNSEHQPTEPLHVTIMPVPLPSSKAMTVRLSWKPIASAEHYDVEIYDASGWSSLGTTLINEKWIKLHEYLSDLSEVSFRVRGAGTTRRSDLYVGRGIGTYMAKGKWNARTVKLL